MVRNFLFIFFFILFTGRISYATSDSISSQVSYKTFVRYYFEKDFFTATPSIFSPDSSVFGIEKYNPAARKHYNYLGINGSAANPQLFITDFSPYSITRINSYDIQLLTSDDIAVYRTNKRFTELKYHSSAFKDQRINVFHSQNLTKNWNANLIFDRQGVKDFMNYSDTYRSRFSLSSAYSSPGKKYYLFTHAIWNRIKNQVNGGLINDSLFDNTNVSNLGIKGLAYNITGAEQHVRKRIFYLSQYYRLNNSKTDSVSTAKTFSIYIRHQVSYERNAFTYTDAEADSSYYSNFYYGSITEDSTGSDELKNRIELFLKPESTHSGLMGKLSASVFAENIRTEFHQQTDSTWENSMIGVKAGLKPDSVFPGFSGDVNYVPDGMDKENYRITGTLLSPEYSFGNFELKATAARTSAPFYHRFYRSNNFIWTNDFLPVKSLSGIIQYKYPLYDIELKGEITRISNYTYLNTNAFPDQFEGDITFHRVSIMKNFKFRKWHLNNLIIYQRTGNDQIVHLPEWITEQSLYIEKPYFKNALLLCMGISANFNSSYFADAFMPSNGLFYLQNEKKTGGYFRADLFINAKIKTARIFLAMENILDNVIDRSYYLVPHYPMPGRILKFGVVWWFLDQ